MAAQLTIGCLRLGPARGLTRFSSAPNGLTQRERFRSLRQFHSTPHRSSGSLFNLSGLSVSRESRFLSKERGIPRTEFSPHLELIRSSEVEPFTGKEERRSSPQTSHQQHTADSHEHSRTVEYLIRELEKISETNAKAEACLKVWQARCQKREREASILAVVTLVSTVGLFYTIGLGQSMQSQTSSARAQVPSDVYTLMDSQHGGSAAGHHHQNTTSAIPSHPRSRFAWSELFWAS